MESEESMSEAPSFNREQSSGANRLLSRLVDVRPEETKAMLLSAAFFFFILTAYFILRPIRDEIAVSAGTSKLPWLFAGTLTATLVCNPLFSSLVAKLPVRRAVQVTYHVIAATMIVFYGIRQLLSSSLDLRIGVGFFIWISVIALFVTSVFWSFMADNFGSDQAKRLFGFIGVGGTLGSVTGSALTSVLAKSIGTSNLLLVSALFFEIGVFVVSRIPRIAAAGTSAADTRAADEKRAIGGSAWSGIYSVFRSKYLFGIAVFLIIYTIGSTLLYAQQTDMVGKYYADKAARTQVLARVELAVQVLTLVTQIFFTGRIIRWIGLAAALAILPLVSALGFGALGLTPVPAVLFGFMILRRGSNFALTNPSMEALFTVVSREDKYKAKSFIETFVYRGGDQIGAWTYAGLTAIGLSLSGVAYAAIPMCAVWLVLGVWLGRRHGRLASASEAVSSPHVMPMPAAVGQAR